MKRINVRAYAKLNLSLDVAKRRDDGYHDLVMVMQTASLCDDVCIEITPCGYQASTNLRFIPNDERNLAIKAAKAYFSAAGISAGASIAIKKRIPVGAGMGGGSSDAAAVLRGLNRLYGNRFSSAKLEEIGASVGSDVPFCVVGGTQLAKGRGEILSPLPSLPDCHIVICKPDFSISTPELFRKLDSVPIRCHPDTQGLIEGLVNGDLKGIARRMYNVFEDVPDRRHCSIAAIRGELLDKGALGSIMTGSGSAVFGLFDDMDKAQRACSDLSGRHVSAYLAKNIPALRV